MVDSNRGGRGGRDALREEIQGMLRDINRQVLSDTEAFLKAFASMADESEPEPESTGRTADEGRLADQAAIYEAAKEILRADQEKAKQLFEKQLREKIAGDMGGDERDVSLNDIAAKIEALGDLDAVRIDFGKPVQSMVLPPATAKNLAEILLGVVRFLESRNAAKSKAAASSSLRRD